jgi:hypothetical protein
MMLSENRFALFGIMLWPRQRLYSAGLKIRAAFRAARFALRQALFTRSRFTLGKLLGIASIAEPNVCVRVTPQDGLKRL